MSIKRFFPETRPTLDLNFAATKRLDPRITYTRASTAVYYDGQTQIKAEENLALYSEDFTNAWWQKQGTAVSGNASTSPNGTLTADKLIAGVSGEPTPNRYYLRYSAPLASSSNIAGSATLSVFAKAGEYDFVYFLNDSGASNQAAFFNVASGTVATVSGGNVSNATITATTVSGWYRCSAVMTDGGGTGRAMGIGVSNANGALAFSGDGSSGVFIWGAQYERRAVLTPYTPTVSSSVTNYQPQLLTAAVNQPRFDHNPATGESLGLLVEEARTNLVTYSEQFNDASWIVDGTTVTENSIVAPNGALTGDKLIETATTAAHRIYDELGVAVSTAYTASVYAKAGERSWVSLSGPTNNRAWFNLATGAVGTVNAGLTASIQAVGNGWYRCFVTQTTGSTQGYLDVGIASADNTYSYTGDGTSGIFVWGAQLETGTFATSYIPTTGSTVTRAGDVTDITGINFSSWFNSSAGTVSVSTKTLGILPAAGARGAWSINDNTFTNEMSLLNLGIYYRGFAKSGNISFDGLWLNSTEFPSITTGVSYDATGASWNYNGTTPTNSSTAGAFSATQLEFGNDAQNRRGSTYIKRFTYWPFRLPDDQLQAITQ